MMIDLEQLKADRKAGTDGPWRKRKCQCGHPSCKQYTITPQGSVGFDEADADRITRLPDLEDAYLEAIDLLKRWATGYDSALQPTREFLIKQYGRMNDG